MLSTHIRSFTTVRMSSSHSVCPALDWWPSLTGRDQEIRPEICYCVHGLGQWNKLRCYICPKAAVLKKLTRLENRDTDKRSNDDNFEYLRHNDGDTWKMVGILSSNAHLQASAGDINFIPLWINLRASTFCSCIFPSLNMNEWASKMPSNHFRCLYTFYETGRNTLRWMDVGGENIVNAWCNELHQAIDEFRRDLTDKI